MNRLQTMILVVLAALLAVPSAYAADDEKPTLNEQAEEYAKEFQKGLRKMSSGEIVEGIDKLVALYNDKKVDDDDAREEIIDALEKVRRVRDNVIIAHLMEKCGEMDEVAVKVILPTLAWELKQKVPDESVYEEALDSLGKLHVENKIVIKTLTDLLNHKEFPIIARACRSMAGYAQADGEVRKELFEEILKASEGTYSSAQAQNETYKRKWAVIGEDVMDALRKLSHVKLDNPVQARSWFNDHKKESWDPEDRR